MLAAIEALAALIGRALPRLAKTTSVLCVVSTFLLWAALASGESGGPGGAVGEVIVGVLSLVLLVAGVGLLAGAIRNLGLGVGLLLGMVCLVLVERTHLAPSHPLGAVLVLFTACALGALWSARSKLRLRK